MIYGWSGEPWSHETNAEGKEVYHYIPRAGKATFMVAIPVFFLVEYTIAHFWTSYVDPWCARATKWLEDTMFEDENEKHGMQYA